MERKIKKIESRYFIIFTFFLSLEKKLRREYNEFYAEYTYTSEYFFLIIALILQNFVCLLLLAFKKVPILLSYLSQEMIPNNIFLGEFSEIVECAGESSGRDTLACDSRVHSELA